MNNTTYGGRSPAFRRRRNLERRLRREAQSFLMKRRWLQERLGDLTAAQ